MSGQADRQNENTTADRLAETLTERISGYVTALMVDDRSVTACEKAMDEAIEDLLAAFRLSRERETALVEALLEIAGHPIVSESTIADDNCDWHCTAGMVNTALAVLAGAEATSPEERTLVIAARPDEPTLQAAGDRLHKAGFVVPPAEETTEATE